MSVLFDFPGNKKFQSCGGPKRIDDVPAVVATMKQSLLLSTSAALTPSTDGLEIRINGVVPLAVSTQFHAEKSSTQRVYRYLLLYTGSATTTAAATSKNGSGRNRPYPPEHTKNDAGATPPPP